MLFALLFNLVRLCGAPLRWARRLLLRRRGTWVHLRLDRPIVDIPPYETRLRRWLSWSSPRPLALSQIRAVSDVLRVDPAVLGVVLEVPATLRVGWAAALGLRQQIADWRAAGKRVVAHLPDGGSAREIYVALAADTIWLAPEATLAFLGLASESMYLKPLLERLGVRVEVHAAGRFKTAAEPLTAERMSDAQREQRQALLDTLHQEFVEAIRASKRMDDAAIANAFAEGLLRGVAAVERGLVDAVCYPDEVGGLLALHAPGASRKPRVISFNQYERWLSAPLWRPILPSPYIAVIPVHGTIGLSASPQGGGANVAALTRALDAVRRDPRAAAVVLHIESPGGSALASDHIHREVSRLAQKKPVVAYFGEVAASGGYYVAAPAQRIIAQATTVTGSIGVISAKIVIEQLLDRVGVRPQILKTAPHANMFSPTHPLEPDEHAIVEREALGLYRTFLNIVAAGRKRPVEEIEPLAGGRVWSGRDALQHGLVDRLGGFEVALAEARALVPELSAAQQGRLVPRVVRSVASQRLLPVMPDRDALLLAWLDRSSPEMAALWAAHQQGMRLLMMHLD